MSEQTYEEYEADREAREAEQLTALAALHFSKPHVVYYGIGDMLELRFASCLKCGATVMLVEGDDGQDQPARVHYFSHNPDLDSDGEQWKNRSPKA